MYAQVRALRCGCCALLLNSSWLSLPHSQPVSKLRKSSLADVLRCDSFDNRGNHSFLACVINRQDPQTMEMVNKSNLCETGTDCIKFPFASTMGMLWTCVAAGGVPMTTYIPTTDPQIVSSSTTPSQITNTPCMNQAANGTNSIGCANGSLSTTIAPTARGTPLCWRAK